MYVRLVSIPVLVSTLVLITLIGAFSIGIDGVGGRFVSAAHAEPKVQEKIKGAIKSVVSLIEQWRRGDVPEGIVKTNGRIEATEIDVSPKYAGRLETVMVNEGDDVKAGQVVARITSPEYQAQLRTAQANVLVASSSLASSEAKVVQAKADLTYAKDDLARGKRLLDGGWLPQQQYDQRVDRYDSDVAGLNAAEKQRDAAKSVVSAAQAEVERINSIITDLTILSPRDGRVQYRLHRSGEVVNAGTRIVQILDLNDVYMTIYLPDAQAGTLAIGDEARLILDSYPNLVIPAYVSFVATEAQFTPKTVETATEREKLMFRVKLQVDPKVLAKYYSRVKTGARGLGFVRLTPSVSWPPNLAVRLPDGE